MTRNLLRHLDEVIVPRLSRAFARLLGPDHRGLRVRLLAGLGLAAAAAVLVSAVLTTHRHQRESQSGALAGPIVHVGVQEGQSIPAYVSTSHAKLHTMVDESTSAQAAPAEVYALVSLKAYLAPNRLTPVLGGVTVSEVYAHVPFGQVQTQIVRIPAYRMPDDVVTGMAQVAKRKQSEADELRALADKLSRVSAVEDQLRGTYLSEASLASAEAAAYQSGCTCVYAAVVRATPVALEEIAARPEVRAVDPAPEVQRLDQAVFLAPLPEQQGDGPEPVASPTPEPSATPSPASSSMPEATEPPTATPSGAPTGVTPSRSIEPLR